MLGKLRPMKYPQKIFGEPHDPHIAKKGLELEFKGRSEEVIATVVKMVDPQRVALVFRDCLPAQAEIYPKDFFIFVSSRRRVLSEE